jgi:membrane-associated phospholipid phosphatase
LEETDQLDSPWRKLIWMCLVSFMLVAMSVVFDQQVAEWVRGLQLKPRLETWPVLAIKSLGVYGVTIAIAVAVAFTHQYRLRAGAFVLLTGLVSLLGSFLKWTIGRTRPFKLEPDTTQAFPYLLQPFNGGFDGLIFQKNLAFPSGHTTVAFATATALAILWPRWWPLFYFLAALVGAQRLLENAHWLSDVVGAAGLAICGVHLLWRIIAPWVSPEPGGKLEPHPTADLSRQA